MNYPETFIVYIDLIDWAKLFLASQEDAINRLAQFQRFARAQLEGDNYLSFVVTFADNVWARCLKSRASLKDLLDKTIEVVEYGKNNGLKPWCVVTSGWLYFDILDQSITTGASVTDIRSQHISGIGDAQVRASCAAKTRRLIENVVWVERQLCADIIGTYDTGSVVNLAGEEKWPFTDRTEFISIAKKT